MKRRFVWGVSVAMVVLGLLIVAASYLQPECMVTVQERGQV